MATRYSEFSGEAPKVQEVTDEILAMVVKRLAIHDVYGPQGRNEWKKALDAYNRRYDLAKVFITTDWCFEGYSEYTYEEGWDEVTLAITALGWQKTYETIGHLMQDLASLNYRYYGSEA